MSAIHGISVGGNLFDVTDSSNVAPIELTGSATRTYVKGRLLILSNGLLYKTTRAINSGETLIANNNIRQTNMDELIAELDTDSNLIAPTENETTSSNDYSIGEQIARSGLLYEVIDDITAGDTFVVDNNIRLVGSVTEQIKAINNTLALKANAADVPTKAQISNPNLLDNPWFTVNQRGFASTSFAVGYTVDRWKVAYNPASNTCELTSNGMVLNSVSHILILQQRFDEEQFKSVVGKMTTFSVLLSDGTMHKGSAIFPQKGDASNTVVIDNDDLYVYYQYNSYSDNLPSVGIYPKVGKTVTIKAVKLELGSVSTLAQDTAPNYATELLKCQRYFVRYLSPDNSGAVIGVGHYSANTNARITIPLPTNMRAKPSIVVSDLSKFRIVVDDGTNTPTAVQVSNIQNHLVAVNFTTPTVTNHLLAILNRTSQGTYIDFSADL